ncbi:MAG: helix-turn-helix domain-containing protein [Clostridia bacterium]|nr:helix-turn-helix domain-containing protein [Clostridia bacterium]
MYHIFEQLLQNRGWTPYEIAKISGVSQATLSDWKNGKSVPRNKTLKKLADCLGVSVGYLKGENKTSDTEVSKVSVEDLKVALFDGNQEVTDEMWEEVKNFAKFVQSREEQKKNNN